jgi:hypothetical protein
MTAIVFYSAILLIPQTVVALPLKESQTGSAQLRGAVRFLLTNVRGSNADFGCHIGPRDVSITDPWSAVVDRIPFSKLRVSVEHPRVGRSDPDIYGRRTLLTIWARGPADKADAPQRCLFYSKLILPERVPQHIWGKVDRLLDAFLALGAAVDQRRPPEDPSAFDEDGSRPTQNIKAPANVLILPPSRPHASISEKGRG